MQILHVTTTTTTKQKTKQNKQKKKPFLVIPENSLRQEANNFMHPTLLIFLCILQPDVCETGNPVNLTGIKPEEYFDCNMDLGIRDIGRPKEVVNKVQKFRATLWLCDRHPLSMHEQVLPIIDLMAISNAHFAKLRDFITLQLPAGFPVKIGKVPHCHYPDPLSGVYLFFSLGGQ